MLNLDSVWFEWNGVKSNSLSSVTAVQGVKLIVRKIPDITSPKRRFASYNVAGRNGNIYVPKDSFDNISVKIDIFLYTEDGSVDNDRLRLFARDIAHWLVPQTQYTVAGYNPFGYGKLRICEEDSYYLAYYTGPLDISNSLYRFGTATIEFSARPEHFTGDDLEKYEDDGQIIGGDRLTAEFTNPGWGQSSPIIALDRRRCKNYDILLDMTPSLGQTSYIRLNGLSEYDQGNSWNWLVIDSERMECRLTYNPFYATAEEVRVRDDDPIVNRNLASGSIFPKYDAVRLIVEAQALSNGTAVADKFPPVMWIQGRWWTL